MDVSRSGGVCRSPRVGLVGATDPGAAHGGGGSGIRPASSTGGDAGRGREGIRRRVLPQCDVQPALDHRRAPGRLRRRRRAGVRGRVDPRVRGEVRHRPPTSRPARPGPLHQRHRAHARRPVGKCGRAIRVVTDHRDSGAGWRRLSNPRIGPDRGRLRDRARRPRRAHPPRSRCRRHEYPRRPRPGGSADGLQGVRLVPCGIHANAPTDDRVAGDRAADAAGGDPRVRAGPGGSARRAAHGGDGDAVDAGGGDSHPRR